jgi:hypothetical protein
MTKLTTDAGGHEIVPLRGLRLCEGCGLVMSVGYSAEEDGGSACSAECMAHAGWTWTMDNQAGNGGEGETVEVPITPELVDALFDDEEDSVGSAQVSWTDWEGDEHSEDALERLLTAPYNWTPDEIKLLEEENA